MDHDQVFAQLTNESAALVAEMEAWRAAHPTATFDEIEVAVNERLDILRARLLQEVALTSTAAGTAGAAAAGYPDCPDCGTRMARKGIRDRTLTVPGDQAVTLTRRYWVCPVCGTGLFPPG